MLDKLTIADCIKFLSESLDKKVKPLVDGWGKFSLRAVLLDWKRRNHDMFAKVHNQGEAIISDVHRQGSAIIKGAHHKKEQIISSVQDKGEELLYKKKQIISNVQDKGEELLAKKKQMISNAQHTGEQLIGEVLHEAKKKIAVLTPHNEGDLSFSRKRRETEDLEALADLLENEGRIQDLNEVDTKMVNEVDAHDFPYNANIKPSIPVIALEPPQPNEYYSLSELSRQLFQWVRERLNLRRFLRSPLVVSA